MSYKAYNLLLQTPYAENMVGSRTLLALVRPKIRVCLGPSFINCPGPTNSGPGTKKFSKNMADLAQNAADPAKLSARFAPIVPQFCFFFAGFGCVESADILTTTADYGPGWIGDLLHTVPDPLGTRANPAKNCVHIWECRLNCQHVQIPKIGILFRVLVLFAPASGLGSG